MSTTRPYVECLNCQRHYFIKKGGLTYSNGVCIENVAGAPEWQRLLCPCRLDRPHKFKLSETVRLHVIADDENERTQFVKVKSKAPTSDRPNKHS
jgi:hypothetical protein